MNLRNIDMVPIPSFFPFPFTLFQKLLQLIILNCFPSCSQVVQWLTSMSKTPQGIVRHAVKVSRHIFRKVIRYCLCRENAPQ